MKRVCDAVIKSKTTFKNDQKVYRLEARGANSDTIRSFWRLFRHFPVIKSETTFKNDQKVHRLVVLKATQFDLFGVFSGTSPPQEAQPTRLSALLDRHGVRTYKHGILSYVNGVFRTTNTTRSYYFIKRKRNTFRLLSSLQSILD